MGRETERMLGAINHREHACGRPMLTAVVVSSVNKRPGSGFFGLAKQAGALPANATRDEERTFWNEELERLYEEWSH